MMKMKIATKDCKKTEKEKHCIILQKGEPKIILRLSFLFMNLKERIFILYSVKK